MNPPVLEADERNTAPLEARIRSRLHGLRHFELVVRPDGVILRGKAKTYYAKQLAQHAVMDMIQARILANDIEVD